MPFVLLEQASKYRGSGFVAFSKRSVNTTDSFWIFIFITFSRVSGVSYLASLYLHKVLVSLILC